MDEYSSAPASTIVELLDKYLSDPTKLPQQSDPLVKLPVSHEMIERVVRIIALSPTKEAYKTNRSLDIHGLFRKRVKDSIWTIDPKHKDLLERQFKQYKGESETTFEDILTLDISLRTKKARGHKWCFVFSMTEQSGRNYDISNPTLTK